MLTKLFDKFMDDYLEKIIVIIIIAIFILICVSMLRGDDKNWRLPLSDVQIMATEVKGLRNDIQTLNAPGDKK